MIRPIDLIIIHCSATRPSQDIGAREIDRWHRAKGWLCIGYHYVIKRDGTVQQGRPVSAVGAHAQGYNQQSIGICLVGGVQEEDGKTPECNFTAQQWIALNDLVDELEHDYPATRVIGHNEVAAKACPSFDVQEWMARKKISTPQVPAETTEGTPEFHTVEKGDTLWGISRGYGVALLTLCHMNGIDPTQIISVGQKIRLRA